MVNAGSGAWPSVLWGSRAESQLICLSELPQKGWRFLPSRGTSTAEKVNKNVQNLGSNLPFSKDHLEFMQGSTSALGDVHS